MKLLRVTAWLFVAALTAAAAWLWLERWQGSAPDQAGAAVQEDFVLINQDGAPLPASWFQEGPLVLFFGFTYCPDICPTTLARISSWLESLGGDADRLKTVFVSIDPARDTPAVLKDYLSHFDPRISAVTGAAEDLRVLADSLGAKFTIAQTGGDYEVAHSASIYLLDAQGRFYGSLREDSLQEIAVGRLRDLLGEGMR